MLALLATVSSAIPVGVGVLVLAAVVVLLLKRGGS